MIEDRIRTSHTYDETTARAVYGALPGHARLLRELGRRLAERVPSISVSSGDRSVPLFDAYVMVDWSGGDSRRGGKGDCIWIAHGARTDAVPATQSPCSRTEAEAAIRLLLEPFAESRENRVLVCADFGYGYPTGFASVLPQSVGGAREPWRVVWEYLRSHMQDDLRTTPGRVPSNRSNRFDVADAINAAASTPGSPGPFWCLPKRQPRVRSAEPAGAAIWRRDRSAPDHGPESEERHAVQALRHGQRREPDAHRHPTPWGSADSSSRHSSVWPLKRIGRPSGAQTDPELRIVHARSASVRATPRTAHPKTRSGPFDVALRRDLDAEGLLVSRDSPIPSGIE